MAPTVVEEKEARDDKAWVDEDESLLIDVLANDRYDRSGNAELFLVTAPEYGTASVEGGAIRYTPLANVFGVDTFTYGVKDADGWSSNAGVEVEIAPVDDKPTAVDDAYTVEAGDSITFDVWDNDLHHDNDYNAIGDYGVPTPQIFTDGFTQPAGILEHIGGGLFKYTASADFAGEDSFTYTLIDHNGLTATATVTLDVLGDGGPDGSGDGSSPGETLKGSDGNDNLDGAMASGVIDGGAGVDVVSYAGSAQGVSLNLATNTNTGGSAQGVTLLNIEGLVGSAHNDMLQGDGTSNVLDGGAGLDRIFGFDGPDSLFGRSATMSWSVAPETIARSAVRAPITRMAETASIF